MGAQSEDAAKFNRASALYFHLFGYASVAASKLVGFLGAGVDVFGEAVTLAL